MNPKNITSYQNIGWNNPPTQASLVTNDDYYAIAAVCAPLHLPRELELCQPKLIIVLGNKAYHMVHSSDDFQTPAPTDNFINLAGKVLLANDVSNSLDKRNNIFRKYNVVHLFHPSFFARGASANNLDLHLHHHIPAVKDFIVSNQIV